MKKAENRVQSEVFATLGGRPEITLFRNHVAQGVTGKITKCTAEEAIVQFPTRANFGLCKGSSDLIGWKTVLITPEMVGQKIAVFTALEIKREGWTPPKESNSKDFEHYATQLNFIQQVLKSGGFAGFAQDTEDALLIVGGANGL